MGFIEEFQLQTDLFLSNKIQSCGYGVGLFTVVSLNTAFDLSLISLIQSNCQSFSLIWLTSFPVSFTIYVSNTSPVEIFSIEFVSLSITKSRGFCLYFFNYQVYKKVANQSQYFSFKSCLERRKVALPVTFCGFAQRGFQSPNVSKVT